MGSSAKKKREKKQDFTKTKLKVGKTRPKNTNATDTSFSAKSIVLKQQNLSENTRDPKTIFEHNISLLSSKSESQRSDALQHLTAAVLSSRESGDALIQPAPSILSKVQPLVLDGSSQVRQQLLKLLRALPPAQIGPVGQLLLYTRAGMTHLSDSIRSSALDILDVLLDIDGDGVVSCAGGWVKTLQTFQNLLSWRNVELPSNAAGNKWTTSKTPSAPLGSKKLLVHQLTSLSRLLYAGLAKPSAQVEQRAAAQRAAAYFPMRDVDAHLLCRKSNPFGYLNLFDTPRDIESEAYDDPDERAEVFVETGLLAAIGNGVQETKKEGGELGRAAAAVEKSLRLVGQG